MTARRPRRYAEGTSVDVGKTRGEIEALLIKHGAHQILSGIDTQRQSGFVGFTLKARQYRIPLLPRDKSFRDGAQVQREQWRGLLLVVKAKLEFVASGLSTHETEFMAHVVLPDGSTVAESIAPRLEEAYATGQVRGLLPA